MKITNNLDIALPMAVWLLHDDYDYNNDANYISVTKLMRPIKQIILPSRVPVEDRSIDLSDFIARRLGNSLHDSIERAWTVGHKSALRALGHPDNVIDRVLINPTPEELKKVEGAIPVYLEQRAHRELPNTGGKILGGKFDMVTEGIVQDTKSTSVYAWIMGTRDDEHQLQGSLYRWIDAGLPEPKITEDYMGVNYIFTDWSKAMARTNPKYPRKIERKEIPLLDLKTTEEWAINKVNNVFKHFKSKQQDLPECTDEELWRSAPQYKYFSNPAKTDGRSTKNFESLGEANQFMNEQGKGVVVTKPGEVKRCHFCDAYSICEQRMRYFPND